MSLTFNPENTYLQLGRIIETMPDLATCELNNIEVNQWLGRAYALVKEAGDIVDTVKFKTSNDNLRSAARDSAVASIHSILFRAFAVMELEAPIGIRGKFIPVGNSFDAFSAISKILTTAKNDVLIVDAYMDAVTLTDFATAVSENVNLRLLADLEGHKSTLVPAAQSWIKQYGINRPLYVRLAATRTLHDRAIFIDGNIAYTLSQSLNAFAARSPAEIIRADDIAQLKISAYEEIWKNSKVLI